MHALGRKPPARIISKEIVTANATVARQLALTRGERVIRIRRVRLADGVPLSFDETYLPLEIVVIRNPSIGLRCIARTPTV